MNITTDWAKIPHGFYLRREYHPGLARGAGGWVHTINVKTSDEPAYNQPHVPAREDSWRHGATTSDFWNWAQENLPVWETAPRVKYSET